MKLNVLRRCYFIQVHVCLFGVSSSFSFLCSLESLSEKDFLKLSKEDQVKLIEDSSSNSPASPPQKKKKKKISDGAAS